MAIKKLQNNFTTPEQSKRLLELGVPVDSADCYLLRTHTKGDTFIVEVLHDELYSKKNKFTNILEYFPCWSVGRLIEIYETCTSCLFERRYTELSVLEDVLAQIAEDIMATDECWDFSKLEE